MKLMLGHAAQWHTHILMSSHRCASYVSLIDFDTSPPAADVNTDSLYNHDHRELQAEGVDTSCVLRAEGRPSPFTYIIVDSSGAERHCWEPPLQT